MDKPGTIPESLACQVLLQVLLRTLAGDHPEIFVKAGEIIETAFKTELFNAQPVFNQELAGMTDAYFGKEL